jgi:phosphoribosylformylglycinamidine synthase
VRNAVCVGADPEHLAILDNFAWGNPEHPEILGALVRAAKACRDVAIAYRTPFISGKDSLYNEFAAQGKRINIPHTLLVSAIGLVRDIRRAMTADFKAPGNTVYLVGITKPELGGSEYFALHSAVGNAVPRLDPAAGRRAAGLVARAIAEGLVRAAHDCSEGGLGVALAEMAFSGEIGARIRLAAVPTAPDGLRDDEILFSESTARYLLEVPEASRKAFETLLGRDVPWARIGETVAEPRLEIAGRDGKPCVHEPLAALKEVWLAPLRW